MTFVDWFWLTVLVGELIALPFAWRYGKLRRIRRERRRLRSLAAFAKEERDGGRQRHT
jgi:hypothetical protein